MSLAVDSHIERRYAIERHIGSGAYGVVWRAIDKKTKQPVALKKVYDAFGVQQDAQRTYREVMILQRLSHPNIIKLLNVLRAVNGNDLYLVFELLETDLHAVIRSGLLKEIHHQFLTYQLLRCMKYIHRKGIIHRDLKPANILINSDCVMKLADFGLARTLADLPAEQEVRPILTEYIATRWYRSPEVLLGTKLYTAAMDMWAVGCIIAEMLTGSPLYRGDSTLQQLSIIVASLGQPGDEDIDALRTEHAHDLLKKLPHPGRPVDKLRDTLMGHPGEAVHLITSLLVFNPRKRMTSHEALCHPYVAPFCAEDERSDSVDFDGPISIPLPDETRFSIGEYRDALYTEITKQKREVRRLRGRRVRHVFSESDLVRDGDDDGGELNQL